MRRDAPTEDFPDGRPLTRNELELDAARFDVRAWNAGARIADDCFCDCCGRRGVLGLCGACSE